MTSTSLIQFRRLFVYFLSAFTVFSSPATPRAAEIAVDAANTLNSCSPWIYGSCIEDVNHEIYGGLYGQRLYGESFEEPCLTNGIAGWTAYGGQWATAAAGTGVAVAADYGAKLVRQQPQFADGSVECDVRFNSQSGDSAGLIVRVRNAGVGADAFDGYEISLGSDGRKISLGRHQQNFASLQTAAIVVSPFQWQHLRVVLTGARIQVYLNGSTAASLDYTDASPLPSGSVGLRTWGSSVQFQNFRSLANAQQVDNTFVASPTSILGWTTYDGQWTPANTSVSVAANFGAKLVRQQPQFADGSVECDVRSSTSTASSTNAGLIVRVRNAGVGADAFDGYEISLASNGTSLTLGRHQQNFASLQTANISVDSTQWQHLRVVLTGGRIQVYLNGSTAASLDYTDASPLPSGSVGLRTWGSSVQFQNFRSLANAQQVDNTFVGVLPPAVSGQWDAVQTSSAQATFALDTQQPYNGNASQRVQYTGGTGVVGVANRGLNRWGIAVRNGSTYSGRIYLRSSQLQGAVTVSLQSADGSQTYASQTFSSVPSAWTKFPFALTVAADDVNARFTVTLNAPGTLWIDQAVLLDPPSGRFRGLPVREDIANAMTTGRLSFVRYGGTAVNSPEYRWKSMIGDPDQRPPYQGNWHPYTSNGFGIEEFIALCERAGIVPAFAVNVEETPQDMADMVEYLNGDATTPWGSLRAANGHPKPYGVKYVEIGNEEVIWGDVAADYDHYIERFKLLAAAMRQKDQNLVFINAAWWRGNNTNCQRVFQALEGIATYWDFHFWTDDANSGRSIDQALSEARQLFQQWVPGAKMKVVIFEENGMLHNLQRALGHATTLNAVRRHGDFVVADCEANGLQPWQQNDNGWDQGHIFFTPSQVWGAPPYHAQQMASANYGPMLVASQIIDGTNLDVTATKSADGRTLCLHVVNLASTSTPTQLKIGNFPGSNNAAQSWTLAGNPGADNSPTNPTAVQPVSRNLGYVGSYFSYTFPANSYTVLRLTASPALGDAPGQSSQDLFVDTFNRDDDVRADYSLGGTYNNLSPILPPGSAWSEGYEAAGAASICIHNHALQMATAGGTSEMGLNHNFVDQSIASAGGFCVSLRVLDLNGVATDPTNRYAGFGVGLDATQAAQGNDIAAFSPRPVRGSTGNPGSADCFVELDLNGNVKVWVHGALAATVPVGSTNGTLTAAFNLAGVATSSLAASTPTSIRRTNSLARKKAATNGFDAGDLVSVTVYFNGTRLNLDPSSSSGALTFNWDGTGANYVALSARAANYALVDNFAVRAGSVAGSLAQDYAASRGLTGASAASTADPDGDGLDNYMEWVFGINPQLSDAVLATTTLLSTNTSTQGFLFSHRRLIDYQAIGVSYKYQVSPDLKNWHDTNALEVSKTGLSNDLGYESVRLKLPDAEVFGHARLFLRLAVPH